MSDAQLLEIYQADGPSLCLEVLFKRYMHLVYGVSLKYLKNKDAAADATQSLFEKLLTDLKTHQIDNFEHWLYRVCRNHCLMILRKAKSSPHSAPEGSLLQLSEDQSEAEEREQWEAQLQLLEHHLQQLKDDQRICIDLFFLRKQSYAQIVEQTNYSLKEVKSHIQNGKRNLRNALEA